MVLAHDLQKSKKTSDIQISQDITFETMLLSLNTLEGLKNSGFVRPSPIQLHGIPLGKCGFDLLLEAKSGTGKTAVFAVIALEKLDLHKGVQAVILAPTREIAAQICDVFKQIGSQYDGLSVEVVMGGLPFHEDVIKFKQNKVHIVVGSPGRLRHLIKTKHLDISGVNLLVLDEADKLMEKSFLPDIKYIHKALPREKQVVMGSATYPKSCKEYINMFVHDAQHICPNNDCILLGVSQRVTYVKYNSNSVIQTSNRLKELLRILRTKQFKQCLIFCNYQARIAEVYKKLTKEKWPAEQLYGAQEQTDRLDVLKTLQEYKCRILISTDLAARGIDASNVDLVINFEPPFEWQTYLHRIGRAGRFGSYGMAITILSEGTEQKKFEESLSAVNLTNTLLPLWSELGTNNGEEAEVSENKINLQLNGCNDKMSTELWKIICDTKKNTNEEKIEDFHEHLNTANETCDIESFSDLFNSYKNNNLSNNNGIQYKCINLPDIPTKHYLTTLKNTLTDTEKEKPESSDKLTNNIIGSQERMCQSFNKQTTQKVESSPTINEECSPKNIETSFLTSEGNSKHKETDYEKVPVKSLTNRICNDSTLYKEHKINLNSAQTLSNSINEANDSKSNKSSKEYRKQSKIKNLRRNKSFYSNNSSSSSNMSQESYIQSEIYHSGQKLSINPYNDWYKQLKIKVRQIELAVYIEELSKL